MKTTIKLCCETMQAWWPQGTSMRKQQQTTTTTINLCEKEEKQSHKQQAWEVGATIILCKHNNQPM